MSSIIKRKLTKSIFLDFVSVTSYQVYINIPYEVSHVNLKSYSRYSVDYENDESVVLLKCDLFKEPLCQIVNEYIRVDPTGADTINYYANKYYSNLDIYNEITQSNVNSAYTFSVVDVQGNAVSNKSTFAMVIVLQLEFVEK